jgi:hypothetical protein
MTEQENPEWQPPPPPEKIADAEPPQMSEVATLGNIFVEPENTFRDLKRKPRFIIAGIILALLVTAYAFGLNYKVGEQGIRSFIEEQIDKSPQAGSLSKEQKNDAVDLQMKINTYSKFAVPVIVFISFFIGGLLYWLGAKAFGGSGGFMHNLSVWVYSGFAPGVVTMLASFVVMFLKNADDIDLALSQKGLVQQYSNLSFLVGKEHPILSTIVSTFDIFSIWGWVLAAIGLRVVNGLSKGSAWTLVIIYTVIGLLFRLVGAMLSGNPT